MPDELDAHAEAEVREILMRRAIEIMRTNFEPTTWRAFWLHSVEDGKAADVAGLLGVTENQVYQQLRGHLAALRLTAAAEALPAELDHARAGQLSHTAFLERLLALEVDAAQHRRQASLARFACLPAASTLAEFAFGRRGAVASGAAAPSWGGTGRSRARTAGRLAVALTVAGWAAHVGSVATRGMAVHRVPWGNMYEFSSMVSLVAVT